MQTAHELIIQNYQKPKEYYPLASVGFYHAWKAQKTSSQMRKSGPANGVSFSVSKDNNSC